MVMSPARTANPIDTLIDNTLEQLDIPQVMHDKAVAEYQAVGRWLAGAAESVNGADWFIFPQGSFILGTVVRPVMGTEYDLDLVSRRDMVKTSITQADLKAGVGATLHDFVESRRGSAGAPSAFREGRRCWTLGYPDQGFHMDVLPAIPDRDAESPSAILLPDRELVEWQHSDPIAYAAWFIQRAEHRLLMKEAHAYVAGVPRFGPRRPLQRAVQVLKRHRDIHFGDDIESTPPSILITTLAALAYTGENGILDVVLNIAADIEKLIKNRAGVWWVANPVAPLENFADKWATHPERRTRFLEWVHKLQRDLADLQSETLPHAIQRMRPMLGDTEVIKAAESLGKGYVGLREQGVLTVGGALTTLGVGGQTVKDHTFCGAR
jgi:hypothetical protein